MSDLRHLWDVQLAFNDKFYMKKLGKQTKDLTFEEKITWTKNQILSIIKEATEVLDELPNWKEHRNEGDANFIPSNLYEEIIDVNKFAVGLAQIWGMNMHEYYNEYLRKSWVVEQRWAQEHELNLIDKNAKIVGIDIDGILGDYPQHFINFVNDWVDKFNPDPDKDIPTYNTLDEIKQSFKVDDYEFVKAQYRQSGWKAYMPANEYASELTEFLKEMGYTVIILTARPYKEYSRIYPDTLEFLKKNDIQFDAIIWDEKKHLKIIKEFPKMKFMIDDDPSVAWNIAKSGYKVFWKENFHSYTKEEIGSWDEVATVRKNIIKIKSLKDVMDYLKNSPL